MVEKIILNIGEFKRYYLPRLHEEEIEAIMEHPELYGTGIVREIFEKISKNSGKE